MKKLKRISKYALIIVGMLAALNWVWSCAEEELSFKDKIQNKLPEGYSLMEDSNIPNDLLGEFFAEGNIPPQEVLDAAGFPESEDAADYQWVVHVKDFSLSDDQTKDLDGSYDYMWILTPNEELQAYIGVKGDVLGNGGKLAIVANDASVVIEDWLGSDDWKNATTRGNAFDVSYAKYDNGEAWFFNFYLEDLDNHRLRENLNLHCVYTANNRLDVDDSVNNLCSFALNTDFTSEHPSVRTDLRTEPLTLADKANQGELIVDGVIFIYPTNNSFPEGSFEPEYYDTSFFNANYETFLAELRKFSDPN